MERVTINGRTRSIKITTESDLTQIRDGTGTDYIVIETKSSLSKEEYLRLFDAGARDPQYVGKDKFYLCQYTPTDLTPVQNLDFVVGVDVFRRDFKITSHLAKYMDTVKRDNNSEKNIYIQLHMTRNSNIAQIAAEVAEKASVPAENVEVIENLGVLEVRGVAALNIGNLQSIDSVKTIDEVVLKAPCNDHARRIIGLSYTVPQICYRGEGQVIAIADTGLDTGKTNDMHPAFKGRIKALIPIGRSKTSNASDTTGHGTHVCGSAIGAPCSTKSGYEDVQGTAPAAELVMQSLWDGTRLAVPELPGLLEMFLAPYRDHNAHIHSNSWGNGTFYGEQNAYSVEEYYVDRLLYDNPDLLIVIAAGNTGDVTNGASIEGVASCKNVLTVGATDSTRPSIHGKPLTNTCSLNDPTAVSWNSARGPTKDQRIKPEVLAPGTPILSARSRELLKLGPNQTASEDPNFFFAYGTSMSTPLVAGCAVVLRQFLVSIGIENPPAALLKAMLINGAYAFHHAHNSKEGFGIVNVANSLIPKKSTDGGFIFGDPLTNKGDTKEQVIEIPATTASESKPLSSHGALNNPRAEPGEGSIGPLPVDPRSFSTLRISPPARHGVTLKVTLAYTDEPGSQLQTNLNLVVESSEGTGRHGNRGSSDLIDRYNNVEQIIWKGIVPGKTKLRVHCERYSGTAQDFALVWRIIPNED